MDFTLDQTQRAVRDLAATVLTGEGDGEAAWKAMTQAGLCSGEDLDVLTGMLVLAEVGRAAALVPALPTIALGVLPLSRLGIELPPGAVVTAALHEPSTAPSTTLHDGVINGLKVGVPYALEAHLILVPVDNDRVALIDPKAPGVSLHRTPTSTGSPEYSLALTDVRPESLHEGLADLHQFALAGACAVATGVLAAALDLTTKHVGTRVQFGKPLAAFQAVAQQIADVYVASRTLDLVTWSACWRLDAGLDARADLAVAAHWLTEEVLVALRTCHHLHGGLGLDVTYPLHRYYSLAKDLCRFVGGADLCLQRLAEVP